LETLRLFGRYSFNMDISHAPHLPWVRRVHCSWSIKEEEFELLTTYIAQLPLVKEVAFLHREKAKVTEVLSWMRGNSTYSGISLTGYRTKWGDLQPWSQPYPYERAEKQIVD
jgi:hypothetical protein